MRLSALCLSVAIALAPTLLAAQPPRLRKICGENTLRLLSVVDWPAHRRGVK